MKNNTFKRVLAGSLALLTVAAYVPANVGGILATNGVSLTAVAADGVAVTWATGTNEIGEYITSITDGTTTINTETTKNAPSWTFAKDSVVTIVSSIPLTLSYGGTSVAGTGKVDASTDLKAKNTSGAYVNLGKYIEIVENNVYTYKVLNDGTAWSLSGVDRTVTFSSAKTNITLGDGNTKELDGFSGTYYVNGGTAPSNLPKNSVAKVSAGKAFEVYVKIDGVQNIEHYVATYDSKSGNFIADVKIPDTDAANVIVYLNKVTPNYAYTNNGTELLATADNAPQVTAASIKATYQNKVRTTVEERKTNGGKEYKYDVVTDMKSGDSVANASRVELTFTNDVTGEITTGSADATPVKYSLKITRDGEELKKTVGSTTGDYVWQDDDPATNNNVDKVYGTDDVTVSKTNTSYVPNADGTITTAGSGEGKLAFTQTGKYVVEYTVYTKTVTNGSTTLKPETLKYEFTIKAKEDLTAENVKLTASGNNLKGAAKDVPGTINKAGIVNGVVEFEVSENWTTSDVITVNPTIFAETDFALTDGSSFAAGATNDDGTPKSITGTQRSSTLDQVNTMTVAYNNPEFGSQDKTITIKWKLVEAKKQATVTPDEVYAYEKGTGAENSRVPLPFSAQPYFRTTEDKIDTIEEDLRATLSIKNAKPEEISFEYVEGYGASTETEELDYHEPGLPKTEGKYTVYAVYDGEPIAWINVQIIKHGLYAAPTAEQLNYTYGTKALTSDDLAFEDVNGEAVDAGVKNAYITYAKAVELTAVQSNKITADGKYNGKTVFVVDGKNYVAGDAVVVDGTNKTVAVAGYLDAGLYVMTVTADETDNDIPDTTIENKDYALETKEFAVNVAKKEITSDMITFAAKDYQNGKNISIEASDLTITDVDVKAVDAGTGAVTPITIAGVISDGTTSASAIGAYSVKVQVDATDAIGKNYTGKVSADWHIVKKANQEAMQGLAFVDKETTIYNNGQIHFEITRPADTQFKNGVAQYGVVFDKSGKIAAPKQNTADWGGVAANALKYDQKNGNYPRQGRGTAGAGGTFTYTNDGSNGFAAAAQFEAATAALQVGNGYTEGKQSAKLKKESPTKYGANVNVKDVETGAWFRPYVIDGEGNIYYGKVVYVNLVQEATDALNLKISQVDNSNLPVGAYTDTQVFTKDDAKKDQSAKALAEKSWRSAVKTGYDTKKNAYYVYGSYTLAEDSNVKTDAVQGFGVVVDKKGVFDATTHKTADGKTTVEDGLKLGKGFIEGKSGSNKMDVDEYGAMISPYNSVTGVWVRAYVDLGNDLVVYTNPIYIKDISSIYNTIDSITNSNSGNGYGLCAMTNVKASNAEFDSTVYNQREAASGFKRAGLFGYVSGTKKVRIGFKPEDIGTTKPSYLGVVVDKTGSFLTKTADRYDTTLAPDKLKEAKAKMLIGNGYVQGKKAPVNRTVTFEGTDYTLNGYYFANVTQETYRPTASAAEENIPVVVRPYAIYEINGKEVVVYGDPKVSAVNG